MDGEVPEGWRKTTVGHVARVDTGGTPSRSRPEYWGGDILWMSSGEVKLKRVRQTAERITRAGLDGSNAKLFPPGTVMVALNGQGRTRGSVAVLEVEAACNQSLAAILCGPELNGRFLLQNLSTRYDELRSLTGDDARNGLNLHLIRGLPMLLPEPCEQAAIARVLDAIDEAIEKTEAVIAATEDLRKALLQELLTRGVPGWHTEWKTVPGIGTIPACWDVVRLGEVASGFQYGTSAKCDGVEQGVPVLRIPNVARGLLDLTDLKYAQLPERELLSLRLEEGDLLFVRTNGNPEICGRVALVKNLEGDWAYASYLVRLRTNERLLPPFLWLYLNEENGRRALSRHIRTSAGNFNLSVGGAASIEVPLPPTREQNQIGASVSSIRAREDCERRQLDGLRELKAWTAGALLSGQVRVTVSEEVMP